MDSKQNQYRIADLAPDERPRERLIQLGAGSLSTAELLAVLLRTGVAGESAVQLGHRLLRKFGGLAGIQRTDISELSNEHGMGEAKASTLKAAIELGRRLTIQTPEARPSISSPSDAAALLSYEMGALEQEHLRAILLDTRNQVIEISDVVRGTLNSAQVRIAELFKQAVRRNAASIIIVHNHPSGDPSPSPDDIALTKVVREAGVLLDIEVLDHVIIGQGRYVSMKERRLGFG